jgi:hypothetical protein
VFAVFTLWDPIAPLTENGKEEKKVDGTHNLDIIFGNNK